MTETTRKISEAHTCSICLESLGESPAIKSRTLTTNCNHEFHYECLRKWARETMKHKRRFFPVGFIPMDDIPMHECPLCRSAVTCYIYRNQIHTLLYAYGYPDNNPYRLRIGTLVYYYYALRQPGTARSGYLGRVKRLAGNADPEHFLVECLWGGPEGGRDGQQQRPTTTHRVPYYCVFDVFFLALPGGGIPTRSRVNVLYVPDHWSQGFVTEERNTLLEVPWETLQEHLRQYLGGTGNAAGSVTHLISPLVPPAVYQDTPLHFFMTVYLQPALSGGSGVTGSSPPQTPPAPLYEIQFSAEQYRRLVLHQAIGLNQARVILAYVKRGFSLPDDVDAPRVLEIMREMRK